MRESFGLAYEVWGVRVEGQGFKVYPATSTSTSTSTSSSSSSSSRSSSSSSSSSTLNGTVMRLGLWPRV